jgi:hypothetical protein
VTLAGAAVGLLAPYVGRFLQSGAERVGEDFGDALVGRLKELFSAVKRRVKGESYAEGALERFEGEPDSELRRTVLQDALAEIVRSDSVFAEQFEKLVKAAAHASGSSVEQIAIGGGAVAGRDFVQNAQFAAGRDQVFGASRTPADEPPATKP